MFDPLAFDQLLGTPESGSRLSWSSARRCVCFGQDGGNSISCPICSGEGYVWSEWSEEFRAGMTSLTGRQIENLSQRWGPGMVGDATISLPPSSPPYCVATPRDRFVALDALDTFEWSLVAGVQVRVPLNAVFAEARAKSNDGLSIVRVPVPIPDANGRIQVSVSTVVRITAPRRYEVVQDATQIRAIMPGLPRRVMVKLVDVSLRW